VANLNYGYVKGERLFIALPVQSGETFAAGDLISLDSNGFIQKASAGDKVIGVAFDPIDSAPAADGAASAQVDVSPVSVYLYPPASGTLTQAMVGKTCDVGGAQSIDITASADDCVLIQAVDTVANLAYITIARQPAGVV
jgi:hypothetical protein